MTNGLFRKGTVFERDGTIRLFSRNIPEKHHSMNGVPEETVPMSFSTIPNLTLTCKQSIKENQICFQKLCRPFCCAL